MPKYTVELLLWKHDADAHGHYPIYIKITIDRQTRYLSTGHSCSRTCNGRINSGARSFGRTRVLILFWWGQTRQNLTAQPVSTGGAFFLIRKQFSFGFHLAGHVYGWPLEYCPRSWDDIPKILAISDLLPPCLSMASDMIDDMFPSLITV